MVNRNDFDAWLAKTAENRGAHVLTNTELIDLEVKSDYTATNATVRTSEGEKEITPRVFIAVDGVDSTVLKLLDSLFIFKKVRLLLRVIRVMSDLELAVGLSTTCRGCRTVVKMFREGLRKQNV